MEELQQKTRIIMDEERKRSKKSIQDRFTTIEKNMKRSLKLKTHATQCREERNNEIEAHLDRIAGQQNRASERLYESKEWREYTAPEFNGQDSLIR